MNILLETEPAAVVEVSKSSRFTVSTALAACWTLLLTLWVLLGAVQLPSAAGLIELEGLNRGSPITDNDHLGYLPELEAAFNTANLSLQHPFAWVLAMGAFAGTGVVLAVSLIVGAAKQPGRIIALMMTVWAIGVAVAMAHRDTLELIMWLTN